MPTIPDSILIIGPLLALAVTPLVARWRARRARRTLPQGRPEPGASCHGGDAWAGFQQARERHPWRET